MSEAVKTEVLDVRLKACRKPRFKAGSELSGKVNRIVINIDQTVNEELDKECLDVDLKWEVEAEGSGCGQE
ncbi:MAG: hypothetical protein ACFHU9_18155 [Fluviicola sp.]